MCTTIRKVDYWRRGGSHTRKKEKKGIETIKAIVVLTNAHSQAEHVRGRKPKCKKGTGCAGACRKKKNKEKGGKGIGTTCREWEKKRVKKSNPKKKDWGGLTRRTSQRLDAEKHEPPKPPGGPVGAGKNMKSNGNRPKERKTKRTQCPPGFPANFGRGRERRGWGALKNTEGGKAGAGNGSS